ncbi:TIGR03364 family FAD-dependent oxidoreductase [Lacunimicrobium album]
MHYDVIIAGSGIVGLGHAWAAAKKGLSVAVFESNGRPEGASIRNFGMIWPIGQPSGEARTLALRNQKLWEELGEAAGFPVENCGSLFLAHHDDEMRVLEEFAAHSSSKGMSLEIISGAEVLKRMPCANPDGLVGGMFSGTERRIHPPTAISSIVAYLNSVVGIDFYFDTPLTRIKDQRVYAADGRAWTANRIVVANGAYYKTLYPDQHREERLKICKLQMMLSVAQPQGWHLGPHMASGLTLRHYPAFNCCPSLQQVKQRVAETMPELDRYGIHVMASTTPNGELILGDSHEYGDDIEPFDKSEIDDLIMREINKVIVLSDARISRRWTGFYAKHPKQMFSVREVEPSVYLVNGLGGNGMSLSLAVSESVIDQWETAKHWEVSNEPA